MKHETFKLIDGFDGCYRVSNLGTVQTKKRRIGNVWHNDGPWRPFAVRPNSDGYHCVILCHHGKMRNFKVHLLVLQYFGPAKPFPKAMGLHSDDDKSNNSIDNLYWGTSKDNRADAMRSGRAYIGKGENNGRAILTEAQVAEIRAFPRHYGYRKILAKRFGVSPLTIKGIIEGKCWKASRNKDREPEQYDKKATRPYLKKLMAQKKSA